MVNGLFLSSGIFGSGSKTTERLLKVVEIIRKKQGFRGYIHMKVMPDTGTAVRGGGLPARN